MTEYRRRDFTTDGSYLPPDAPRTRPAVVLAYQVDAWLDRLMWLAFGAAGVLGLAAVFGWPF